MKETLSTITRTNLYIAFPQNVVRNLKKKQTSLSCCDKTGGGGGVEIPNRKTLKNRLGGSQL